MHPERGCTLLLLTVMAVWGCTPHGEVTDPRDDLERHTQGLDGVPLVVPTELPTGWRYAGISHQSWSSNDRSVRQWRVQFIPTDLSGGRGPVEVCIRGTEDVQALCPAGRVWAGRQHPREWRRDHGHLCGRREADGRRVARVGVDA